MNIEIDKSIITALGTENVSIDDFLFLTIIAKRRNYTVTAPGVSLKEVENYDLLTNLGLSYLINSAYNMQPTPHNSDCLVMVGGESELEDKIFSLHEACDYVNSTAVILLENDLNDGRFIRVIEKIFETQYDFEDLLRNNIIDIRHSGGTDIKNRILFLLSKCNQSPKYLRALAIVDGDSRYPNDTTFENYPKQQETNENSDAYYCKKNGVSYYVLKKRSLENYMPDEVYDNNRDKFGEDWVNAYLTLSPQQKDYYYIAEGFYKDIPKANKEKGELEFDKLPQGVQTLFHDVSEGNYQHLLHGPNLHGSFKSEFPKFFNDPHMCKTALQNRVNHPHSADPDELIHIVEEIRQLL